MFGNKNTQAKEPVKGVSGAPTQGALNSLVMGTIIEGTINADNDIRIDGLLKGVLICKGKVIIGPKGQIEGEIKAQNAVIEGQFKGSLIIEDLLQIKETAHVEGEINTDKLSVSPGAKFNVVSKMASQFTGRNTPPPVRSEDNLK
ncbi:MAG: polymer-forming cytoskeletal protein [Saprospiraceae bacterium]|jgi:cytoskeletal protein CcmA (bactofilin family)|nr:polymer-forming cytoskeletal protein [Candidatus Vicinibacter proximus]MBL7823875.1 polymer-forming cytoskeletal protein [Saprospiraceae bacterium]MCC6841968.1 polymer-forming cytoskeletal protein [Saprospiraceae bacterium]HRG32661.1 polymer-forming cytoskeletal protein [Saprospiraceae bacterium]